jgi:hypothetical protein
MKALKCFLIILATIWLATPANTQAPYSALLVKKNKKTKAKFYPGQSISLQVNGKTMVGLINRIESDGIIVSPQSIHANMHAYGLPVKDTVFSRSAHLLLSSISAIFIPKRYKNDGVYFTERSQSATSVENISAQKGKQFYDTYWNTGEAGYIATAAVNTFFLKKKRKTPKGMNAVGKRYILVVI